MAVSLPSIRITSEKNVFSGSGTVCYSVMNKYRNNPTFGVNRI